MSARYLHFVPDSRW